MSLRTATAADVPGIAEVFIACWHAAYPGVVPDDVLGEIDLEAARQRWARLLHEEHGRWRVIVADDASGRVVGVTRYGRDPDDERLGHLFSLYVHPHHSAGGLGSELLSDATAWFAEQGLVEATLWVFERNAAARQFYEHRGWTAEGGRRVEPEFRAPEIRLRWSAVYQELAELATELPRQDLSNLDLLTTLELVRLMHSEDAAVPMVMVPALPAIATAITAVGERLRQGGRLIYVGAGTAGRLGVLDASECPPTFNTWPGQVVGLIAGGPVALSEAVEGAEDEKPAGARDLLDLGLTPEDAVVGISASGRTPYVLGAVEYARRLGALTVGIACNRAAALSALVQHPIEVEVGSELIAGSTRLKSGTSQKLVLNMISTISMIRLGKTYGTLMVDLKGTNQKLRARSRRIVAEATGRSLAEADAALAAAGGAVKAAILVLELDVDSARAEQLLKECDGNVRRAMDRGRL